MKTLIVYDSLFGNTEKIAQVICKELHAQAVHINRVKQKDISEADHLIVGSPTHAGRATPAIQSFIQQIPEDMLDGKRISAFDTGIPAEGNGFFLKILIHVLGYAAKHIANSLVAKGAVLVGSPVTFFVAGKEGPLIAGEQEKAVNWAQDISK